MCINCLLTVRSDSLVQILFLVCLSISCGSYPVYPHLQWNQVFKHPFAWSSRLIPQLLLRPAAVLAAHVSGWIFPLWQSQCFLEMCYQLQYNLIAVYKLWPVLPLQDSSATSVISTSRGGDGSERKRGKRTEVPLEEVLPSPRTPWACSFTLSI